jgi:hypothetical protein
MKHAQTTDQGCAPEANKAVMTLIAQLALAGHAVHQLHDGEFVVCKYGLTRHCQNFAELQEFAQKLGVAK